MHLLSRETAQFLRWTGMGLAVVPLFVSSAVFVLSPQLLNIPALAMSLQCTLTGIALILAGTGGSGSPEEFNAAREDRR